MKGLVLSVLFFTVLSLRAQSVPLRFQGSVSEDRVRLSGVSLQISKSGRVINNIITDAHGNYAFELPMGGDFMVTVGKEGYVSKKFSVSTMGVPAEQASMRFPSIEVSLSLFKKMEGIDYSLLNQPVSKYYYNIEREDFDYDDNHLKQMLKGIEAIKEQERLLKEKEREKETKYTAAIRAGDKSFNKKEWTAAIGYYQEALGIKSNETYPQLQLDNINKAIADEKSKQKATEDAARLAREKARSDSLAKVEADKSLKLAAAAAAAKALEDKKAKEKAEMELAAKKQAEAAEIRAKAEKDLADKIARDKANADALAKKQAEEAVSKKAAEDAQKAATLAALAKEKNDAELLAKKKADEAAAKAKIDQEIADKQERASKAKADSLALVKKKADEASAKKAADELAAKKAAEIAASKKASEDAAIKKTNDELLAKKAAEDAALKAKAEKTILPVLGASEIAYKEAIKKADAAFSKRRYLDAKSAYEEALMAKSGDVYAKMRLLECERIINSDASQKVDERQKLLLAKYPPGVTEEVIPGDGVVVIRRVLVKDNKAFVFEKKVFSWGGIACFRDGETITELTFEQETRKEK